MVERELDDGFADLIRKTVPHQPGLTLVFRSNLSVISQPMWDRLSLGQSHLSPKVR